MVWSSDQRWNLIAINIVASAQFFHLMVAAFLVHVLKVNVDKARLWGNTKVYYGTVENQGRLTLHLHLLLWIENSPTPQEIRDCLTNGNSDFQQALVRYLEELHKGEFTGGTGEDIILQLNARDWEITGIIRCEWAEHVTVMAELGLVA